MSPSVENLTCPVCSATLNFEQILGRLESDRTFDRLIALSVPLGALVLQYLTLLIPNLVADVGLLIQAAIDQQQKAATDRSVAARPGAARHHAQRARLASAAAAVGGGDGANAQRPRQ